MLVEFCIGNYRSFHHPVSFSLVAANLKSRPSEVDENNVFDAHRNLRLLTSAVVYGANASGKSNLIRALNTMKQMVLESWKGTTATGGIPVERFRMSSATVGEPSYFQVIFLMDGVRYRYGFRATTEQVLSEWLYQALTTREARVFERQQADFTFGEAFREGRELAKNTRANALFLSVAAQLNNPTAAKVVGWFSDTLMVASGLQDDRMRGFTLRALKNPESQDQIAALVQKLDLGISGFRVEVAPADLADLKVPADAPAELREAFEALNKAMKILSRQQDGVPLETVRVKLTHPTFDEEGNAGVAEEFDLSENESDGSQKLFALAGPIWRALKEGTIMVIDEFDARLHPLMSQAIVKVFNSREANPNHAQLIIATHDTSLLDRRFFRRDQVWFVEKDRRGATQLYSLAEFRVRNDASYGRDYIRGMYGAVPYVGDLERIMGERP